MDSALGRFSRVREQSAKESQKDEKNMRLKLLQASSFSQ